MTERTTKNKDSVRYYLVSQDDIDKIDGMIASLNLAITEILDRRPVMDRKKSETSAQDVYHEEVAEIIYRGDLTDHF